MAMVEWKGRTRALCISFSPEQLPYACTAGFSSTWDKYTAAHACRALAGGGDTLLLLHWFASPHLAPLGSSTGRVNSAFPAQSILVLICFCSIWIWWPEVSVLRPGLWFRLPLAVYLCGFRKYRGALAVCAGSGASLPAMPPGWDGLHSQAGKCDTL